MDKLEKKKYRQRKKWEREREKKHKCSISKMFMTYDECQCNCASCTSEIAKEFHVSIWKHWNVYTPRVKRQPYTNAILFIQIFYYIFFSLLFVPVLQIHISVGIHRIKRQRTYTEWKKEKIISKLHDEAHAHTHWSHGGSLYMFYRCFCGSLIAAVAAYITTASVLCEFRTHKPKMYH